MSKAGAVEKVLGGRAAAKEVQMTKTRIGRFAFSAAIRFTLTSQANSTSQNEMCAGYKSRWIFSDSPQCLRDPGRTPAAQ